jgi:hypothetical protein
LRKTSKQGLKWQGPNYLGKQLEHNELTIWGQYPSTRGGQDWRWTNTPWGFSKDLGSTRCSNILTKERSKDERQSKEIESRENIWRTLNKTPCEYFIDYLDII